VQIKLKLEHLSVAWPKGDKALFLWQRCDHDRVILVQHPPSSDTLLLPWIRRFTMIISAWWLWTSSKFSG